MSNDILIAGPDNKPLQNTDALGNLTNENGQHGLIINFPKPTNSGESPMRILSENPNPNTTKTTIMKILGSTSFQVIDNKETQALGEDSYTCAFMPLYSTPENIPMTGNWISTTELYQIGSRGMGAEAHRSVQEDFFGAKPTRNNNDVFVLFVERIAQETDDITESRIVEKVYPLWQNNKGSSNDFFIECVDEVAAEILLPKIYATIEQMNSED